MLYLYENNKLLINLDSSYHCNFCDVSTWLSRSQWIAYNLSLLRVGWASLVAQLVKNLPAMKETWVRSLGGEDSLEEGMATHSSILAWRIPMDRGAWWATAQGVAKSRTRLSD